MTLVIDSVENFPIRWKIPSDVEEDNEIKNYKVETTVCLLKRYIKDSENKTTPKMEMRGVTTKPFIVLYWQSEYFDNYFAKLDNYYNVSVINGSPKYHYVDLTNVTGSLKISVESNDGICGRISVHKLKCPISEYNSHWQHISNIGVISIDAEDYYNEDEKGFFLMFKAFASDCPCDPVPGKQI